MILASSTEVFYGLDDMFQTLFLFFDWVQNKANVAFLLLGFVGFFMWFNFQRKFNAKAKNDPNQIK